LQGWGSGDGAGRVRAPGADHPRFGDVAFAFARFCPLRANCPGIRLQGLQLAAWRHKNGKKTEKIWTNPHGD
jgi:hypothetical protein